mgnify:FL=1
MCGFIGKISYNSINIESIKNNNKRIECRGPDETTFLNGAFCNLFNNKDNLNFSFGFNRLAIVDLGKNSSQPMVNKEKKTTVMFNGEIFNHRLLRIEMEKNGIIFNSNHSDTEVVLNGLSYYGLDFLDKLIGQFAIIFYQSELKKLFLIRDRVGQKPLFYARTDTNVIFGSNLISVADEFSSKSLNAEAYNDYLNYGVVPSPNTIYENVYKVKPAEIVEFNFNDSSVKENKFTYWNLQDYMDNEKFNEEIFKKLISNSIEIREEADVPIANFLSGGIDSSYIIKNMHERGKNINTFSVVFENQNYDERKWSREVANRYNTNHIEIEMSVNDIDRNIFSSIKAYDEPYSDPSTVPSFLISKLMSENYKSAISGDGGDELLGGYKRINYLLSNKSNFKKLYPFLNNFYPKHYGTGNYFLRNAKDLREATAAYFSDKNLISYLNIDDSFFYEKNIYTELGYKYKSILNTEYSFFLSEMMMLKVDRASMYNSLEVRSPFVDHRLLEYIFKTEPSYLDTNYPKKIFKKSLSEDFGKAFLERPKQGFVFNIEDWIFKNQEMIMNIILDTDTLSIYNSAKLKKLFNKKTRINGLRLWKIFQISYYLDSNL